MRRTSVSRIYRNSKRNYESSNKKIHTIGKQGIRAIRKPRGLDKALNAIDIIERVVGDLRTSLDVKKVAPNIKKRTRPRYGHSGKDSGKGPYSVYAGDIKNRKKRRHV